MPYASRRKPRFKTFATLKGFVMNKKNVKSLLIAALLTCAVLTTGCSPPLQPSRPVLPEAPALPKSLQKQPGQVSYSECAAQNIASWEQQLNVTESLPKGSSTLSVVTPCVLPPSN